MATIAEDVKHAERRLHALREVAKYEGIVADGERTMAKDKERLDAARRALEKIDKVPVVPQVSLRDNAIACLQCATYEIKITRDDRAFVFNRPRMFPPLSAEHRALLPIQIPGTSLTAIDALVAGGASVVVLVDPNDMLVDVSTQEHVREMRKHIARYREQLRRAVFYVAVADAVRAASEIHDEHSRVINMIRETT